MTLLTVLIVFSGLSFLGYGIEYFVSPKMKAEFKRFGLGRIGTLTAILQILGGAGLLVGLTLHPVLLIASGGLTLLMFFGVLVRIKMKDSIWVSLPAFFFFVLNACIFYLSLP